MEAGGELERKKQTHTPRDPVLILDTHVFFFFSTLLRSSRRRTHCFNDDEGKEKKRKEGGNVQYHLAERPGVVGPCIRGEAH